MIADPIPSGQEPSDPFTNIFHGYFTGVREIEK